ncbi:MAG: VOC family protein [Candidatus Nanopelagicales bacterium]
MRLDHISYAVPSAVLADTVQRMGAQLGAGFIDGGVHPSFGTRNFVLPLEGGTYLEVVAALDHPAADQAPFGRAVRHRSRLGGGWMAWVVAVDDISTMEARLGRPAVDGHRRRPDGYDLTWRQIGVADVLEDPSMPFFVQWTSPESEHPSRAASPRVSAVSCELAGDLAKIHDYLGGPLDPPVDTTKIIRVEAEDPGLVAVHFETSHGPVRVD